MFNNWINVHDAVGVARNLSPKNVKKILSRVLHRSTERTVHCFTPDKRSEDHWWNVEAVVRRWNRMISGDPDVDFYTWVVGKYLSDRDDYRAMSVACGSGHREIKLAKTGRFASIHGYDLTPARIEEARRDAAEAGLSDVLEFSVRDVRDLRLAEGERYDIVIGAHAIHHLSPLREILEALSGCLKPGGLFILDEYVGPTRWQWTDEQLRYINHLLGILPERLKVRSYDGRIKKKAIRPSKLNMIHKDPSEAIESGMILPLMDSIFERVELRGYGGAVVHRLLTNIAQNFRDDDPEAQAFLKVIFDAEDALMAHCGLPSDFAAGVYRKRNGLEGSVQPPVAGI